MFRLDCYFIKDNDVKIGLFKDDDSAKKWLIKILNDKKCLDEWFTNDDVKIVGVENIYNEFTKLNMNEIICGLEEPGDIKIKFIPLVEDEL